MPNYKINSYPNMLQEPSAKNLDAKRQTQTDPCQPTSLRQLHLMLSRFHRESEALPSSTRLFCTNTSVIYHSHKIHSSVRSHYVNGQLITQFNQIFILFFFCFNKCFYCGIYTWSIMCLVCDKSVLYRCEHIS